MHAATLASALQTLYNIKVFNQLCLFCKGINTIFLKRTLPFIAKYSRLGHTYPYANKDMHVYNVQVCVCVYTHRRTAQQFLHFKINMVF